MRILAFDTSTVVASVAVADGKKTLAEVSGPAETKHGDTLLSTIQTALERANITLAQTDLIAVGIGPGSFTGVRVGLATAKGLALATGKPLIGVVSLRALARGTAQTEGLIAPMVDAYRNEVYSALYQLDGADRLTEKLPPLNQTPEKTAERLRLAAEGSPILLCGNGARRYGRQLVELAGKSARLADPAYDAPRAAALAQEARLAFEQEGPSDLSALEPLYLRPSDAQLPRRLIGPTKVPD